MNKQQFPSQLTSHPRILFTQYELEKRKKTLVDNQDAFNDFMEKAQMYAAETEFQVSYPMCNVTITVQLPLVQMEPLPEPSGYVDFPFWTMYSRAIEERITVLSWAYALTQNKLFSEKVKEYLLALTRFTRWFEFVHRGAEGNLSNAHFTIAVATGYDAVFDALNQEEKRLIQNAIVEKGLKPFEIDFLNNDNHNIIASKKVAMLIGAIAVLDEKEVETYFSNAYDYLCSYLDARLISPDIEGLLYTNVAARHILMAADILHRATGDTTLIEHPYFKNFLPELFMYMMGNENAASFANFSDSFYSLDISYLMGILVMKNRNPVASWYMRNFTHANQSVFFELAEMVDPISPDRYYGKQKSKVFPTIGWAAFRNGWSENSHFLAFTSSESAKDHNHYDQNNFILHAGGEWLITNPGYQDYVEGPRREFTLGTIGHNSMLVNGKGQEKLGESKLRDSYTSPFFDYCLGDASGAYGCLLNSWERKIFHVDQTYFILIDRVHKNSADCELAFLYHTTAIPMANDHPLKMDKLIEGEQVDFVGENASVSLYHCYPKTALKVIKQFPGAEEYGTFLSIEPTENKQEEIAITLIQPQPKGTSENLKYTVFKEDDQIQLKIIRNENLITDYFLLNENRGSVYMSSNDISFTINGEQAWVCIEKNQNLPAKAVLLNGFELSFKGKQYIKTNRKMDVMIYNRKNSFQYTLILNEETTIHIPCAHPSNVKINNDKGDRITTEFHRRKEAIEFVLLKGTYEIETKF